MDGSVLYSSRRLRTAIVVSFEFAYCIALMCVLSGLVVAEGVAPRPPRERKAEVYIGYVSRVPIGARLRQATVTRETSRFYGTVLRNCTVQTAQQRRHSTIQVEVHPARPMRSADRSRLPQIPPHQPSSYCTCPCLTCARTFTQRHFACLGLDWTAWTVGHQCVADGSQGEMLASWIWIRRAIHSARSIPWVRFLSCDYLVTACTHKVRRSL